MRSNVLQLTLLAGLAASGLVLSRLPTAAADDVKAVAIVKNADGKFVFTDTNAKIKEGQSVKWVAVDSGVTHQLVPDSEGDALTDTGAFDSTSSPNQKFATPGTIHYHCAIHPKSMRGTINVAATDAPAEEAKSEPKAQAEEPVEKAPAPKKRKAKPSYGYGY
ncbi:MAG: plastocyanin/azurin family copper-binding protein [Hyphomicrobium sp.]|nr:plastocyanin/azurin family copper-binding protein [Hyphomicrobium sp.]